MQRSSRGTIAQREGLDEYYVLDSEGGRLTAYDWGKTYTRSSQDNEIVQVQFKNGRSAYYLNPDLLNVQKGDIVALAASPGHDIGIVMLTGWLARRNYARHQCAHSDEGGLLCLYRKASENDIERWLEGIAREYDAMLKSRQIAQELGLKMKISDVEFQGDGTKALFYYSADKRVDFREMVRILAGEFKVRIEMRQIGPRQEAGRVGGIGTCGQRLCCESWMRSFASVTTTSIKMQDLTPNPQKQGGQCGKLKCCLNFEVDAYEDAKKKMPCLKGPLQLEDGQLFHVKNDLFRGYMWFSPEPRSSANLIMLTTAQVLQILDQNAKGQKGGAIEMMRSKQKAATEPTIGFKGVIEEESITRFDKQKRRSKPRRKPRSSRNSNSGKKNG